jgi:serine/threonine protein kinase
MSPIRPRNDRPLQAARSASQTTESMPDARLDHDASPGLSGVHFPSPTEASAADTPGFRDVETMPVPPGEVAPSTDELGRCLARALGTRFELLRPIAIGGMAVLFQLRHRLTGGLFVAKIMRPELLHEQGLREAFAREACIGASLAGHPNAVAILDLDKAAGDTPFLLMPYIDGDDLDHVLAMRRRLERDEALMLLAQMGSLLMYAETQGIVHADIALGNIRLDRFGQYRLLDYGLARGPGVGLDDAHAMAGTPAYNSPEQLRGEPLDIRSDLYSLGLVFFHALTGRPPFATDDVDELAQAHLTGAWQLPEDLALDIALSALLRKLLATDRAARLSSAFELAGALAALGYELPSFLRSLPVPQPALPKLRRRRLEQAE